MERGQFRNPRGGRGGRGGHRGGAHQGGGDKTAERPKKEAILDLNRFMDKKMRVKFNGGREVIGVLKGFDQLMNVVLDDVEEVMRDDEGNESTRSLGLVVARGTLLVVISPVDGSAEISNPFAAAEEE
ncbi:U6 snRNA-associated Sm-like protein LSm7 [Microthyrium microscopicum]|uniref:U6 snRNA-associated Sm-like protein LSm7 n=1 Tax=Microthyrium microscopicum TaxID=703497 RepID=A0A6A6TVU7_9PEZI|nr:U6 snRNA-associated Sm-like protein LSm7 [Microthyrium microscopicum]